MIIHELIKNRRFVFNIALFFNCYFLVAQKEYFQQRVDYKMEVRLHDDRHALSAYTEINYVNNSSEELSYIYFHLWPNAYRNNSTALAKQLQWQSKTDLLFSAPEERGYIDSLDFKVNGKSVKWEYDQEHIDICKLLLNEPLKAKDSVKITTPFYVKIPDAKFSRLGHTYQSYYITQWYPKPAVFDKFGWHPMPYLDQGEFYSEFGSFDVKIILPENYVVCATGDKVDVSETEEAFVQTKLNETEKYLDGGTTPEQNPVSPESSKITKRLHFIQSNVHDFAWFADKRFLVMKGEIELPESKRKVDTWVYFTPKNSSLWKKAINYVNASTLFYSSLNGDYPYNQVSAVDGSIMAGGGMEYPNVTVIGEAYSDSELDMVITHEVGHNWFYGILGSNERDHPFLDEGLNSFYEMRYIRNKYPEEKLTEFIGRDTTFKLFGINKIPYWKYHELSFFKALRSATDQELALPATDFDEINYGSIVYSKSALVFDYIMDYMGEKNFDAAMRSYFQTYKFKHPNPNDLFNTLSTYSGKDLVDFRQHLVSSTDRIDYKIKSVKKNEEGGYTLSLKNKTGVNLPFNIYAYKDDKPVKVVWYDGFENKRKVTIAAADVDFFKIDGLEKMPDINRRNNVIKARGLFKKGKPLSLRFLSRVEDPTKTTLNYVPLAAGNFYNGVMLGMAFHNYSFYQKRFEYLVAPMYAFNTKSITGFAEFNLNLYPKKIVRQITLGAKTKTFSYDYYNSSFLNENLGTSFNDMYFNFYKIAPYIWLDLKKKDPTSLISQSITYSNNSLFTDSLDTRVFPTFAVSSPRKKTSYSFVNQLNYTLVNKRLIDPFSFYFDLQHTAGMAKVSGTLYYKISVGRRSNIDLRLFAGAFLAGNENERSYYAFRASGYNGWHDYLFESNFAARNERGGFGFTQFTEKDGALKVWTPLGQTAEWLTSLNVKSPKLFILPVKVFADVVVCDGRSLLDDAFLWDAGLNIVLWNEIVEIYLPLAYSADIRKTLDLNGVDFYHSIRFTFNIHKLAPKKTLQNNLF